MRPTTYLLLLLSLLAGCGYQCRTAPSKTYRTISIPYIEGDGDGRVTAQIVHAIATSTPFRYVAGKSDLILKGKVITNEIAQIGYKYDRTPGGVIEDRLIPDEGRRDVMLEFTIHSGDKKVLGPLQVAGSGNFDFVNPDTINDLSFIDPAGVTQSVLTFSLGQLDAKEGASDAALNVAFSEIAAKIAKAVCTIR